MLFSAELSLAAYKHIFPVRHDPVSAGGGQYIAYSEGTGLRHREAADHDPPVASGGANPGRSTGQWKLREVACGRH